LIGCGQHGRLLLDALAAVPGVELVACADPRPEALAAVPGAQVARFPDYHDLLARVELDAVIVATTHAALAPAALAALAAGRHVFCEKPLARSAAEARPVVAAAERAGRSLMVGYVLRYDPLRRRLKALLDAGAVGKIAYVLAGKGGRPHTGWLARRAEGGGQLLWVGSHLVDQVNWLLGRPAERVYAEVEWRADGGTDETSVFTVRYAGGILAHFDCSQATQGSYDFVEVAGSHGRVRADWRPIYRLTVQSDALLEYRDPTTVAPLQEDLLGKYTAELAEFVASVRERRPPAIGGADALRALEVLDAVVASAERGAPVTLH
jgi:predicted dehydrogenase